MTDFVRNEELQQHLQTPSLARMHWSVTCGWELAEAMSDALIKHLRMRIAASPFWSVSLDEAIAIDKTSWLCCHIYIIEDFKRVPVFVKLAQVTEAPSAEQLLQSSKHAEAALAFEREAKRTAAARALFGAESVAAAAAARIATDRQEKDPNTRGQIATLLHLVRSSDVKLISVERLLFASS